MVSFFNQLGCGFVKEEEVKYEIERVCGSVWFGVVKEEKWERDVTGENEMKTDVRAGF